MNGLTTQQVNEQRAKYGLNQLPEVKPNPVMLFVRKLISPVPILMIIATIIVRESISHVFIVNNAVFRVVCLVIM